MAFENSLSCFFCFKPNCSTRSSKYKTSLEKFFFCSFNSRIALELLSALCNSLFFLLIPLLFKFSDLLMSFFLLSSFFKSLPINFLLIFLFNLFLLNNSYALIEVDSLRRPVGESGRGAELSTGVK